MKDTRSKKSLFGLATVTIASLIYPIWGYLETHDIVDGERGKAMMGYVCSLFCGGVIVATVAFGLLAVSISERRRERAQNVADALEQGNEMSVYTER